MAHLREPSCCGSYACFEACIETKQEEVDVSLDVLGVGDTYQLVTPIFVLLLSGDVR